MNFDTQNIEAFIQLLKTQFLLLSETNRLALLDLNSKLSDLSDDVEEISEAILEWCETRTAIDEALSNIRVTLSDNPLERSKSDSSKQTTASPKTYKNKLQEAIQLTLDFSSAQPSVSRATHVPEQNLQHTEELLATTRQMTNESHKIRQISSGTRKTVKIGSKGETIRMTDISDELTEELMRDLLGSDVNLADTGKNAGTGTSSSSQRLLVTLPYYTDISCPRQIWEKTPRISVVVRLRVNYPEHSDAPVEELLVNPELPVRVRVDAPAFKTLNKPEQEVTIEHNADSIPLVFDLQPLAQVGPTRINFDFFQAGNPIGTTSIPVEITATEVSSEPEPARGMLLRSQIVTQPPDLMLYIKYEQFQHQRALRFTLFRDGGFGRDFSPVPLNEDPKTYAASLYNKLKDLTNLTTALKDLTNLTSVTARKLVPNDLPKVMHPDEVEQNVEEKLKKLGYRLWSELIPDDLKSLYTENRNIWHNQTLLIVSDEAYIPWELVWPYDGRNQWEDEMPWCISMHLTRWLRRDDKGNGHEVAHSQLCLNQLACIAPKDSKLEYAQLERQFLREQVSKYNLRDVSPSNSLLSEIRELLESSQYDWLHIAAHGNFHDHIPDDASAIYLENNEKLTLDDLRGPQIEGHIYKSRPAFVFNACHSGRQAWALTGLGGWPNRLISAGAGLFLAPLWRVSDDLALEFAKTFYQELLNGRTVAEAVRKSRLAARRSGDSTWLAYSVYAHPNAKVHLG